MAFSKDCSIVIMHLKEAKKNDRIDICRRHFGTIRYGSIIVDKHFETIYYFPESFSNHDVQANMKRNRFKIFSSVNQCLCSLNQQTRNVVLADNDHALATDKTDSLIQVFQDLSNTYGAIFYFEYNAVKNCLKEKTKLKNGIKDFVTSKHTEKSQSTADCVSTKRESRKTNTIRTEITVLKPREKMEKKLNNLKYFPNSNLLFVFNGTPIFRPKYSLTDIVNSDIHYLYDGRSPLGTIEPDCAELSPIDVASTPRSQEPHQTHTREYTAHSVTVNNTNPTQTRLFEDASISDSNPLCIDGTQGQSRNSQRSPKYSRYSTYDSRLASFATFREFRNLRIEEMARTGLFYTGKADVVQCFQCGTEHRNWRPEKDPLLEHIKESPSCQFLETLLGASTLNQYKRQIRTTGKISGRESFSNLSIDGGATGGIPVPIFTDSDHIRSPQYQKYPTRLSTFSKWPPSMTQKPEQVAQAGFYYTGLDDVVRCFACDGGLKNWDPEDEPWIEHARWFPQCPFVQKVKGQDFIDLVRRMTEESDEKEDVLVHTTFQRNNPIANHPYLQYRNDVGNYPDEPSQLDTDAAQIVIQTGYSRNTVAIAIDLLISKGKSDYTAQDIMDVIFEKEDRGELLSTNSDSELHRTPSQIIGAIQSDKEECDTENDAGDTKTILRENKSLKTIVTCIKCKAKARNTLFLPCSHHCLCQICADKCSLCPMCYKIIRQKIKTFML